MPCEEKARLITEFDRTVRAYSVAVQEMALRVGTTPKDRYQKLKRATEDLRLQCERARLNLEHHTATHRC
jgi:hypothetical protein